MDLLIFIFPICDKAVFHYCNYVQFNIFFEIVEILRIQYNVYIHMGDLEKLWFSYFF